jgi:hypothetical protein
VVAKHSAERKHSTNFKRAWVMANIPTYLSYITSEAIKITKHSHDFNNQDGYRLNKTWFHFFTPKPTMEPPSSNSHGTPFLIHMGRRRRTRRLEEMAKKINHLLSLLALSMGSSSI